LLCLFAGLNHSGELLPMQPVGAWISSLGPSALSTWLSPMVCGTVTRLIEPGSFQVVATLNASDPHGR
jgi:hypothetical protein